MCGCIMKKIILAVCFLFLVQFFTKSSVLADEIIDANGTVTPCKIITVVDGFIEYTKDGNLYRFAREKDSAVFSDYVDVRENLLKRYGIKRYSGKIVVKDVEGVKMRINGTDIDIPRYRIKFIGIYKPE
jgi:hypothetical protein